MNRAHAGGAFRGEASWASTVLAGAMALMTAGEVAGEFQQRAKLFAAGAAANENMGTSAAISGDWVISGAIRVSSLAGAAYVFRRNGTSWAQQQKLTAFGGAAGDYFGQSVGISGDTAIVGAYYHDLGLLTNCGAAYVYKWNGSTWQEEQKLTNSDGHVNHYFGRAVATLGDTALVGAWGDSNNGVAAGAAYVFTRSGSTWAQQQKLTALDASVTDGFGWWVALDGNRALITAYNDGPKGAGSGSAYVFLWNGSTWVQEQKLVPSDGAGADYFGWSGDISGDTVVVGAYKDDHGGYTDAGSAYVFRWNGSSWVQEQKLMNATPANNDQFGWSTAIGGRYVLVGTPTDDDVGVDTGSASVFKWNGTNWAPLQKLLPSPGSYFGTAADLDGENGVVGAAWEAGAANGAGTVRVYTYVPYGSIITLR